MEWYLLCWSTQRRHGVDGILCRGEQTSSEALGSSGWATTSCTGEATVRNEVIQTKNWVWGREGSSVAEGRQGWRQPLILGFAQVLIHCDLWGHKVPADSVRMLYFSYIFWPLFSYYICSRFYPVQFNKQLLSTAFGYWVPTTPKLSGLKQQHSSTCPQFCHLGSS